MMTDSDSSKHVHRRFYFIKVGIHEVFSHPLLLFKFGKWILFDADTQNQVSNTEVSKAYFDLTATGFRVVRTPNYEGMKTYPSKGTVVDIDAIFVHVEGDDGETYALVKRDFYIVYELPPVQEPELVELTESETRVD